MKHHLIDITKDTSRLEVAHYVNLVFHTSTQLQPTDSETSL